MKKIWIIIFAIIALAIFLIFDHSLLNLVNTIKFPALSSIFSALLFIEIEPYFEIWLIAAMFFIMKKNKKKITWLIIAMVIASIITLILKNIIARPRPSNLFNEKSNSFPSGHATLLFATLPFIETMNNKTLKTVWIIFTAILAFTRIYSNMHYFSDILTGFVIGYGTSFFIKKWKITK